MAGIAGRMTRNRSCVCAIAALLLALPHARAQDGPAPDTFGGYDSSHIIIQARTGFAAAVRASHARNGGQLGDAARRVMSRKLDNSFRRWGVTQMRPIFETGFSHPDLAAKYGLDRYYVLDTARGTNAIAMAADFAADGDEIAVAGVDTIGGVGAVIPDDPDFDQQWGLNNDGSIAGSVADADIDAPEAWEITTGEVEDPVIIAIIDSGVDPHPEFADRMIPGYNTADPDPTGTDDDCYLKHGTHVTGIAAASGNNDLGIAGVCWGCEIMPIDVLLDSAGGCGGDVADLAEGITWAADHDADVINMSLQYYNLNALQTILLQNTVNYANDLGVVIVAATGNTLHAGVGPVAYPANLENTLAVGGITKANQVASIDFGTASWSSNIGPEIDVVAPGDHILSTLPPAAYQNLSGTSMATPHVSGIAALIRSIVPDMPPQAVCRLIKDTAVPIDAPPGVLDHPEYYTGHGRANAYDVLAAAPDYPRILDSDPPDGAIDARRPFDPSDSGVRYGWSTVTLTFPEATIATVSIDDFELVQTGGSTANTPTIASVEQVDADHLLLTLDEPIVPGAWTSIIHTISGSRIDLGFMPGDVNGDTAATATDILELIDFLNGVGDPHKLWSTDVDRSGGTNATDILEVIDLLNGAGEYPAYNNTRLPPL